MTRVKAYRLKRKDRPLLEGRPLGSGKAAPRSHTTAKSTTVSVFALEYRVEAVVTLSDHENNSSKKPRGAKQYVNTGEANLWRRVNVVTANYGRIFSSLPSFPQMQCCRVVPSILVRRVHAAKMQLSSSVVVVMLVEPITSSIEMSANAQRLYQHSNELTLQVHLPASQPQLEHEQEAFPQPAIVI